MKKFKVVFDIEHLFSPSGKENTLELCHTIEANSFQVTSSGALIFDDDSGYNIGAVPPGVWKLVKKIK